MNRYKGKAARWQQQNKEEQRMNKTEFIKVRCTLEEKQRVKSKAESAGRKFFFPYLQNRHLSDSTTPIFVWMMRYIRS